MDKLTRLQVANPGDHNGEKAVASDVERDAESDIARTLVHLAGKLSVTDVKLAEHVTWGQSHFRKILGIPSRQDDAAVLRVLPQGVNDLL
jgi:hypothetical protein